MSSANPLLNLQYPIPFDHIRTEHLEPGITELIGRAERQVEEIAASARPRTWENTMAALDAASDPLDTAIAAVRQLEAVATTPELREAWNKIEPLAMAFYARIPLHEGLWRLLQEYAATDEATSLTGVRKRFLEKTIASFRRQGAALPPDKKAELEKIDVELAQITTRFSENVLDSTNAFELILTAEEQLAGLPESARTMARESARSKNVAGWRFSLQQPSYIAVMTYLDDRAVRERVYRAYQSRATGGQYDNTALLDKILELRRAKAALLSYRDFADFVLEDRMAQTGSRAQSFLQDLRAKTEPFFLRENQDLAEFRRQIEAASAPSLQPWDISYYAEKLRKARYDFDEEMLRPYFPLPRVLGGMFELVQRLYAISVTVNPGIPGWDPAVQFHEVRDADGSLLGAFYADWHPRENKRGGAWMDAFITGRPSIKGWEPHLGLMCGNLTPPMEGKPALLTHEEVETIFHEFGHLLHHILSRVEIKSLAGTNVAWDFVELPSQIMENWCWEREALDLFARHWETGKPLPEDLYQKMKRARTFRAANAQMRQLSLGFLDMALHREYSPERDGNVILYSRRLLDEFSPAPLPDDHAMINSFSHLFSGPVGYAAAYYSYKWAEVLDADAFTLFRRLGIFSPEAGSRFRSRILERGDSEDPAQLYRSFMGRDPDPAALLERAGLVA